MKQTLGTLPVVSDAGVVAARQGARRFAETLGLDRQAQVRFATAVSEIARNACRHGRGGEIAFFVDAAAPQPQFGAAVSDVGPGIAELDAILAGQTTFAPGHGTGLVHARRLVDTFGVETGAKGTVVQLAQRLPRAAAARLTPQLLDDARQVLAGRRGDPIAALREQDRELVDSLTALQERQNEALRLNRELEETNRGVVALHSELEQQADALRSASDMKSRFLSQMSHEFRTPLNSILALARLLADGVDGALNAEQALQVDYIRRSAQELLEMVGDLLDLAKVEAGKLDVRPAPCDAAAVFAALRGSLRPLLSNPAVELVFDDPAGVPELHTDEQKLMQILRNLIANALRFTERGRVQVSAACVPGADQVRFDVRDTGIGIAAGSLETIFEEFSQVDGRLQRGGTGLGLPLSRRLAQLLGGSIAVASTPGAGSTFTLTLPLRHGQADAGAGAPRQQVLVIDDEDAFRYVVRHIAADAGYDVIEACDASEGLALALHHNPRTVILDLHLPGGDDGTALLQQLRAARRDAPPVIVCTARPLTAEVRRTLGAAFAVLPKHEVSRDSLTALLHAAAATPRSAAGA